jgi:hypothetical protein
VTPEGRTGNTGEIFLNKNEEGKLNPTTSAQTFSFIVAAEPNFARPCTKRNGSSTKRDPQKYERKDTSRRSVPEASATSMACSPVRRKRT